MAESNYAHIPLASLSAVRDKRREDWLALFAEDAHVEDPVGPAVWDPEGKGQRGKEAIAGFYDMFSSRQASFDYDIHHLVAIGNEIAVDVTMTSVMHDGTSNPTRAINLYVIGEDGLVKNLRSFWTR